jgi:hypothetical protein
MNNGTGDTGAVNNPQTIKLELSVEEVNIVLAGLGELPAKVSIVIIEKVRSQAVNQLQVNQFDDAPSDLPVN